MTAHASIPTKTLQFPCLLTASDQHAAVSVSGKLAVATLAMTYHVCVAVRIAAHGACSYKWGYK